MNVQDFWSIALSEIYFTFGYKIAILIFFRGFLTTIKIFNRQKTVYNL